ncbi:LamG-like jellyroll fold domain-containing protein [Microbacterium sp. ZW T5_45]|uniref:LamG-like jellyroll fold domain-containing protein n=1 Tax=Microbacterium sp. ZW T5_45 TaxID=3378080 RepID=UPI00385239CB
MRITPRLFGGIAAVAVCAALVAPSAATAAGPSVPAEVPAAPSLIADFTFDTAGATFAGGGAVATTKGTATVVPGVDGNAVKLGSSFWLDVTKNDGTPLLAGLDAVTISYDSKPDATGNTGWTVFAAENATAQSYGNEHYLGYLDRTTGVTVERYDNSGGRNTAGNLGVTKNDTAWKHVDLVLSGSDAQLFVNGQRVAVNTTGPRLSDILGASGGILQVGKANWGSGEYFAGLVDNLKIYDGALRPADLGVAPTASDPAAALAIPSEITGDLPSSVLGRAVSWTATGTGAERVAADGAVTVPASGEVAVSLTARIDGVETPITAESTILAIGGEISTSIKEVTVANGVKSDPLAYDDDRRADALYVSARAEGAEAWEPLNRGQAILYVGWDGTQSAKPNAQMGSPTLLRQRDGMLAAASSQNNATDSIYVWDSADGATFTNQRAVKIATDGSIVTDPRIVFDAAASTYKVFWTDRLTGEGRVTRIAELTASAVPGTATAADIRAVGAQESSIFALADDEFETFFEYYVDLQNTGVRDLETVEVEVGAEITAADLPAAVTLDYNDDSTKQLGVAWDEADLAAIDTSLPGEYEVTGVVQQATEQMVSDARADPDLFFNEDDGYWYLTGSHYEIPSDAPSSQLIDAYAYRKIGLKRATTIERLAAAPEQIVIDPDAGTPGRTAQYPNTFYGWGGYIWAQEFHKINGRWWIVAGMNKGYAPTNGWCDNTVLIPYIGTQESLEAGGLVDPTNWGEPTVLEGAAFDVSYLEREENGVTQGYWIMPNAAKLFVAKAKMGPIGTVPLIDGALTEIYSISQPWEYGKSAPTPSDANEGTDQGIVEAPFMFEYGDYTYITYSGGTVDKYYDLGMLRAAKGADLAKPSSWTRVSFPVLTTNDTADGRIGGVGHGGPGHNSFAIDDEGNLVLAYHARPYPEQHTGNAAGGLFDPDRNSWFKSVNVRANGMLDLSLSSEQEVAHQNRTVSVTVRVAEAASPVESAVTTRCVAGKAVLVVTLRNTGSTPVGVSVATVYGSKELPRIAAGKSVSTSLSTRLADLPAGSVAVRVADAAQPSTASFAAASCG